MRQLVRRRAPLAARLDHIDVLVLDQIGQTGSVVKRPREGAGHLAIVNLVPEATPVVDTVMANLSNLGTITDEAAGMTFGTTWQITEFGKACLGVLRSIDEDAS